MRLLLPLTLFSILLSHTGNAEVLRGANATISISGAYDDDKVVTINRGNGKKEAITIKKSDLFGGYQGFAMDVSAMNAYLASGKGLDIPSEFNNAKSFLDYASEKRGRIEDTITDPVARRYIMNLRMDGVQYIDNTEKCETIRTYQAKENKPAPATR